MNFKSRALMVAKAISVWWGIFLILGCCIGFTLNIVSGFIGISESDKFEMKLFIPIMIAGSLILSVLAYIISDAANRIPAKRMRRKLDKTMCEKGVCKEYTDILNSHCSGEIRSAVCIELSLACLVSGSEIRAKEQLARTDIVSILDIAQSTGNYIIPAYYYAVLILINIAGRDYDGMKETFSSGSFYMDELDSDFFITSVKAIAELKSGKPEDALKSAEKSESLMQLCPKGRVPLIKAVSSASNSRVFFGNGLMDEAQKSLADAREFSVTPQFENELTSLDSEIKENCLGT